MQDKWKGKENVRTGDEVTRICKILIAALSESFWLELKFL